MRKKPFIIGTRASNLAMAQAEMLKAALQTVDPTLEICFASMTTAGDRELQKDLSSWGFKGLFTRELEEGLINGSVDLAVHSTKDMPSLLPEGLILAATLPRAEVRDAWISRQHTSIEALPKGAVVGTSSTRRAAQLLHLRPDVQIVPFRGNVQTRLRKLDEGVAEATFLAAAGLHRLGLEDRIRSYIPTQTMLPAAAQGAIGIECRADRADLLALLAQLNHAPTFHAITAERAFLAALDGSCRTPIGGLALLEGDYLHLRGEILSLDGAIRHVREMSSSVDDAQKLGAALGAALRADAGEALLRQCQTVTP